MNRIELKDVTLEYELRPESGSSLKEAFVNLIHRRKYAMGGTRLFRAVNGVSFTVNEGDRLGIIGLNGSGKSTLLKIMAGILQPTAGTIQVDGTVQPLIEIGAGFNPEFSGRENIYLNGYMLGFSKRQVREKEQEIIDFAELGEFIEIPVKYYSSGMAVRLAFTIATMIEPEILLFDEMLGAGDAQFIEKAKARMRKILDQAKMIVLVSHDLGLIKSLCKTCLVMSHGKVVFAGSPEDAIGYYQENIVKG